MKKLLLTSLLLALFFAGFCQPKKSKLYGTWILESSVFTTEDSVYREGESYKKEMKIVSPGHFIFIINKTSDNSFIMASGGRAIIDGDNYTEIIDYSSRPDALNQTYRFKAKVVGDKWYHTGLIGNWKLEEVWRRKK
ncbi:hypothetical protein [Daejeonella oryzae]|uniref:hypothetical protein n=1 Tax=Daejeonella oryzae TaxID=1122943 RepID=UPI0003FAB8B4|nr:hypothetical protein [Daejeonella oryzae]